MTRVNTLIKMNHSEPIHSPFLSLRFDPIVQAKDFLVSCFQIYAEHENGMGISFSQRLFCFFFEAIFVDFINFFKDEMCQNIILFPSSFFNTFFK
jgi:hypothetical protein